MKFVITLGLLIGHVFAQSISIDRIVNIIHYPANDLAYQREGKFLFDSLINPKFFYDRKAVINSPKRRYVYTKFDFSKKKVSTIYHGYFTGSVDSISSIKVLNDHQIEVNICVKSDERQRREDMDLAPGQLVKYLSYIIDLKENKVTMNCYYTNYGRIYSMVLVEKTLDKLQLNIFSNS